MYNDVIGIVGGMGSYATVDFFKRLIDAFPAEKEWERPRILIDNRCTMPSRVRAILYKEQTDKLAEMLADSVKSLIHSGTTKVILACNTSHYFLPDIYNYVPEAKGKIVNIIEETCDYIFQKTKSDDVTLLASEGTIESGIFQEYMNKGNKSINVLYPSSEDFDNQRTIIEAVKQNMITQSEIDLLCNMINNASSDVVILGCTEFPIAYKSVPTEKIKKIIVDPLQCVIEKLKKDIK